MFRDLTLISVENIPCNPGDRPRTQVHPHTGTLGTGHKALHPVRLTLRQVFWILVIQACHDLEVTRPILRGFAAGVPMRIKGADVALGVVAAAAQSSRARSPALCRAYDVPLELTAAFVERWIRAATGDELRFKCGVVLAAWVR